MTVLAYILILAGVLSALADCCDLGEKDSNGVFYPSGLLFLVGVVLVGLGLWALNHVATKEQEAKDTAIFETLCYTGTDPLYFIDSSGEKHTLAKCDSK
jgi:hypothetical protein